MADYTEGLLKGLQQGIGAYYDASERRKDREMRQAELDDAKRWRKQQMEADFYRGGLLPKYDESGERIIGAEVNEPVMKAKHDADPMQQMIKGLQIKNMATEQEEKARGTEGERKAVGFSTRMQQAENVFNELEKAGYDRSSIKEGAREAVSGLLPIAKSTELGKQQQAERNFVNSVLRRESGAAISPSEFQNAEVQYFPRVGDTPEVVEQKRQNRLTAIQGIQQEAGRALEYQAKKGLVSPMAPQQAEARKLSPEDQQALQWAESNPNDPRAKAILKKLGM